MTTLLILLAAVLLGIGAYNLSCAFVDVPTAHQKEQIRTCTEYCRNSTHTGIIYHEGNSHCRSYGSVGTLFTIIYPIGWISGYGIIHPYVVLHLSEGI